MNNKYCYNYLKLISFVMNIVVVTGESKKHWYGIGSPEIVCKSVMK